MSGRMYPGCEDYIDPSDIVCCEALEAECLACQAGVSPYEYCMHKPDTTGCENYHCDPEMHCEENITCVGEFLYPTACGPKNCDRAIGKCRS